MPELCKQKGINRFVDGWITPHHRDAHKVISQPMLLQQHDAAGAGSCCHCCEGWWRDLLLLRGGNAELLLRKQLLLRDTGLPKLLLSQK